VTTPERLKHFKRLEVSARKGLSQARHPDECPKLKLQGVGFAIPPRWGESAPRFKDGRVVGLEEGEDALPQADLLLELIPSNELRRCEACGRILASEIPVGTEAGAKFLLCAFNLASALLRKQYTLTDAQLGELFAFVPDETPDWIGQLLWWCCRGQTQIPEVELPSVDPALLVSAHAAAERPEGETELPGGAAEGPTRPSAQTLELWHGKSAFDIEKGDHSHPIVREAIHEQSRGQMEQGASPATSAAALLGRANAHYGYNVNVKYNVPSPGTANTTMTRTTGAQP